MRRLKRWCMLLLLVVIVACGITLWFTSKPVTLKESLVSELGEEEYEKVYSKVQTEIANYIVQYGFLTDSWVIEKEPIYTKSAIIFKAKLKDGTVLNATYCTDTGECYVETENNIEPDTSM